MKYFSDTQNCATINRRKGYNQKLLKYFWAISNFKTEAYLTVLAVSGGLSFG